MIVAFVLLLVWLLTYPIAANYVLAGWLCGAALLNSLCAGIVVPTLVG
ncbi:hypothetical protein [Candidatus Viridilinea mediisalina]|nr:hypothetical protein [Candidatus Viridilinea mediisalina]